jgi:hypothetical protein
MSSTAPVFVVPALATTAKVQVCLPIPADHRLELVGIHPQLSRCRHHADGSSWEPGE